MTDLETELREALRSRTDGVSAAELRYADGPRERAVPMGRRRVLLPLAAAAAVVAIGSGAAIWAGSRSADRPATTGGHTMGVRGGAAIVGTHWDLVSVSMAGRTVSIPTRVGARVSFERGGQYAANDGVNDSSARYRTTGSGVVISEPVSTLAGYAGHDPAVEAAMRGIGALTGAVSVSIDGGTLTLRVHDTTLTLVRGDVDPGFTGVSADPTSTTSSTAVAPTPTPTPS